MSIREELILKVLSKEDSIVELADQYGVSRKTIYKWLARYQKRGLAGLVDDSRRPHSSPMKTSAEMALEIVQMKKEHPTWGPKKLAGVLMRKYPGKPIPSVVTIGRVLREMGLMKRRRRASRAVSRSHPRTSFPSSRTTSGRSTSRVGGKRRTARSASR